MLTTERFTPCSNGTQCETIACIDWYTAHPSVNQQLTCFNDTQNPCEVCLEPPCDCFNCQTSSGECLSY